MEFIAQSLEDVLATLRPLVVEWQDDTARRVIAEIEALPVKSSYTVSDLKRFLDINFDDGLLICRLFLGLSKDQFTAALRNALKEGGSGARAYRKAPDAFLEALVGLGILEAMGEQTGAPPASAARAVTDGAGDNGIDAIYFDESNRRLYLVQSKWMKNGVGEPDMARSKTLWEGSMISSICNSSDSMRRCRQWRRSSKARSMIPIPGMKS